LLERRSTTMQQGMEGAAGRSEPCPLRVVLAGGGTGGHLYPALAVAERVRVEGGAVLFVGTRRGLGARVVPEHGYPIAFVRARGLTGGLGGAFLALYHTAVGLVQSVVLLAEEKPDLVIGSGGYVCVPVVLAASLLRIPAILLEQNAIPGKATRLLSRVARKVCVSLPDCRQGLPPGRVVVTGNPVRQEILSRDRGSARQGLGLPEGRTCILVSGASQGAASLNRAVLKALPVWRAQEWTVLHLAGPAHLEQVRAQARGLVSGSTLDYRVIGYQEDMAELYAAADVVVCRAGATTLAEVTARGLPAVLVPYPHAAERHQDHNAAVLEGHGAAWVLADEMVEEHLAQRVLDLVGAPQVLEQMARASRKLGRADAASAVLQVARQEARWGRVSPPRCRHGSSVHSSSVHSSSVHSSSVHSSSVQGSEERGR